MMSSIIHQQSILSKTISFNPNYSSSKKFLTLKVSSSFSSSASSLHLSQTLKNPSFQTQNPLSTFLKTSCITLAAAHAGETIIDSDEEDKERTFEERHPDDVNALKGLLEVKMNSSKFQEAIGLVQILTQIEPSDNEWPMLKAYLYSYIGDVQFAKSEFEEILAKNPLSVEAYHGLLMAVSQSQGDELVNVTKRIENAMEMCKEEEKKKKEDLKDFKLLVAQVRVVEGKCDEALKIYETIVKEDPTDFRPYLCQGIIYSRLGKKDEADNQFKLFRQHVPNGHCYTNFEDNMIGTKIFSQAAET